MIRETVRDYTGRVIGFLEKDFNGDIVAKNYAGRVLGKYEKATNTTKDYCGRILYHGNMVSSLLG